MLAWDAWLIWVWFGLCWLATGHDYEYRRWDERGPALNPFTRTCRHCGKHDFADVGWPGRWICSHV